MNDLHGHCNDGLGQAPNPLTSGDGKNSLSFIAEVATGLWRIRRKVQPLGEAAGPADLRTVCRHVESTLDVLANSEIEIRDDTGAQYVAGTALKVVAFQPTEGLKQETICETIRPSVYYKGTLIQRGEVIVGTPPGQHDEGDAPAMGVVAQPNGTATNSVPAQNDPADNKLTGSPERQEPST